MPDKEQWAQWKDNPCTQAMLVLLREVREEGFKEISYGGDDSALLTLGAKIGKINCLTAIINFGFIPEEEENDRTSQEG